VTFEQDFRWYERDCLEPSEWLPLCLDIKQRYVAGSASTGGSVRPPLPQGRQKLESLADEDEVGRYANIVQSVKPIELAVCVSPELHEFILTFNIAARAKRGLLMWAGYNVSEKKTSGKVDCVAFGSQCIVFSVESARIILQDMQGRRPRLFDMYMKDNIGNLGTSWSRPGLEKLSESCFTSPPSGGFYEHVTEVYGGKVRESFWDAAWAQEGSVGAVRLTDIPRILMKWVGKGDKVAELVSRLPPTFEDFEQYIWKTMLPPPAACRNDDLFVKILISLRYVWGDADTWCGPSRVKGEGWRWNRSLTDYEYQSFQI